MAGRPPKIPGRTSHPREYCTWANMIRRCTNPNDPDWRYYGGRGIKVCKEWRTFSNFLADMGERPAHTSVERRDNSKGYERRNCVSADRETQGRNRSNARQQKSAGIGKDAGRLMGAQVSADRRNAISKAAADRVRDRWGAEGYTQAALVAEAGMNVRTIVRWLGKWGDAKRRLERNAKRAAQKAALEQRV